MSRIKLIVNPTAGRGKAEDLGDKVRRHMQKLQADCDMVKTRSKGDGITRAQDAVDEGYDTVVAVGGDGTINEVINGLMNRGNGTAAATFGCVPAGSGNDFAMMNGMPTDLDHACRIILEGHTRQIDVGRVVVDDQLDRYFDNIVGVGFDGAATEETDKMSHLRGLALYLPAVLKTIFVSSDTPQIRLTVDDESREMEILMVATCNGLREGGAFLVAPDARFDDGLLDVIIGERIPRLEILALLPRLLRGTHMSHRAISSVRGKNVTITSDESLHLHVDGEVLTEEAYCVEMSLLPGALRLIQPKL